MTKTGISTETKLFAKNAQLWKPPLSTAFFYKAEYHNGAKELWQDFLCTKTAIIATNSMSHTAHKIEGAGLVCMVFTKKDMRRAVSFHPSPRNTQQQDLRNVCPYCVTREGQHCQHNVWPTVRFDDALLFAMSTLSSFGVLTLSDHTTQVPLTCISTKYLVQYCRIYCSPG